jgi:DNA-directed RNA polymerase specialized sigma subunit
VSDWWDEAEYEADDWGERSSAILRLTKLISESKFLTDRQKRVLYGVYVFSEKRKDIAEDLGVSMKTVQRDHKDALKLLGLVKGRGLLDKEES